MNKIEDQIERRHWGAIWKITEDLSESGYSEAYRNWSDQEAFNVFAKYYFDADIDKAAHTSLHNVQFYHVQNALSENPSGRGNPGRITITEGQVGTGTYHDNYIQVHGHTYRTNHRYTPDGVSIGVEGRKGNDAILGNGRANHLWGADRSITNDGSYRGYTDHDYLRGGMGNDVLYGGGGNDYLEGNQDKDILNGGAGHDLLKGGQEDDILTGKKGNDLLIGGIGSDKLTGGSGYDRFFFEDNPLIHWDEDRITDFGDGDKIKFGDHFERLGLTVETDTINSKIHIKSDVTEKTVLEVNVEASMVTIGKDFIHAQFEGTMNHIVHTDWNEGGSSIRSWTANFVQHV